MKKYKRIIGALIAAAAVSAAVSVNASANAGCTAADSQFLNDIGLCSDRWGTDYTITHWGEVSKAVDKAWEAAGVRSVTKFFFDNEYYIDGKKIDRTDAINRAADSLGKQIDINKYTDGPDDDSDFDYHM